MATTLCARCQSLDLSVAKFCMNTPNAGEESRRSTIPNITRSRYDLGTMTQIKDSAENCHLCALIADTVRGASVPQMDDMTCYLTWEVDGRDFEDGQLVNRTRRLRVSWDSKELGPFEAHIMLAAPSKYDKSDIGYPGLLNDENQHLGRRIGSHYNKRNLIREFLRLCETCHDNRCTGKLGIEDPFRETLEEPYFGVIDIEDDKLVPLPYWYDDDHLCFKAYATVSYVWGIGLSRQHATRISNIRSRLESSGLSAVIRQLPKALQQSIKLVQELGIRYIWIDSLCIVQDSRHSWNLNARAMHLIYGNSTLTVCAADGDDATTGLAALEGTNQTPQRVVKYADGVCLMLHRPAESSIERTRWNKRAWTFQERLLSKRCLIFTEGKIFFQCRSTCMSEDIFIDRLGRGWSLDLVRAPLQMLSHLKKRALWFYVHCVEIYTVRDLYEPFDILSAFNGMLKLMEGTMQAPFIFGIPTSHFDFALLWQPTGKAQRLRRAAVSDDPKYSDMRFPSWSWCGWSSQGVAYDLDMVQGCMADIRDWIVNYTWIDWHIRDGYGTLRRVWDTRHAKGDQSENERWRGYKTVPEWQDQRVRFEPRDERRRDYETVPEWRDQRFRPKARDERQRDYETMAEWRDQRARSESEDNDPDLESTESHDNDVMPRRRTISKTTESRSRTNRLMSNPIVVQEQRQGLSRGYKADKYDKYGRPFARQPTHSRSPPEFKLTLPEDPYSVLTTEDRREFIPSSTGEDFPDQHFLQFFTWRASFHVLRCDAELPRTHSRPSVNGNSRKESATTGQGEVLWRCDITDLRGDKCGSVLVDTEWLRDKESDGETLFEFIAVSHAKAFTEKEFPDWTYYIPNERVESEWDLYFVLLVEFYPEEGIYRRVALGKVFKAVFTHSEDEWKEIILG